MTIDEVVDRIVDLVIAANPGRELRVPNSAIHRLIAALLFDERRQILDTPEFRAFADAVVLEAQHQRARWGVDHDSGKTPADWHWLLGWLSSKAVMNPLEPGEDAQEKRLHRIITVAAACANWHAQELGKSNMRPGIEPPMDLG